MSKRHYSIITQNPVPPPPPLKVCLKYLVNDCIWKEFVASNTPQTLSNLICLTNFVNLRPLGL